MIIITGSGPDIGKTVVSAIFVSSLQGDYWKPIECGSEENSDTATIRSLVNPAHHCIFEPAYALKAPLSPHHAARLENTTIEARFIHPPRTTRCLIVETAGGICVPLTHSILSLDVLKSWNARWVVVSKHYLGSINHTLLTIQTLKNLHIPVAGIVFNGEPNQDSEMAILTFSQLPLLGRLLPEANLNPLIIQKYAKQWKATLCQHLL